MCRCPTDAPAEHKSSRSTIQRLNSQVWANTAILNQCELDKGTLDAPLCSKHFTGKAGEGVETKTPLLQECPSDPIQAATNKNVLIFTQIMAANINFSSYIWVDRRMRMQRPETSKHYTHCLTTTGYKFVLANAPSALTPSKTLREIPMFNTGVWHQLRPKAILEDPWQA